MSEWFQLYQAWLIAHPWAKRVSWSCSHAHHTPPDPNYQHVPNIAQKAHQTMVKPRLLPDPKFTRKSA